MIEVRGVQSKKEGRKSCVKENKIIFLIQYIYSEALATGSIIKS